MFFTEAFIQWILASLDFSTTNQNLIGGVTIPGTLMLTKTQVEQLDRSEANHRWEPLENSKLLKYDRLKGERLQKGGR